MTTAKPVCKQPKQNFSDDPPIERCGTAKGVTFCVGDRVQRTLKTLKVVRKGVVLGVQMGADNAGRKQLAARVCFDYDEPGALAYPYLFSELKKIK
jgi:hypothetical protein